MTEYRNYVIEGDGTFGMKVIKYPGAGGGIPNCLKGSYSNEKLAKQAIDVYLTFKQEEADKPAPIKKVKLTPREVVEDGEADSNSID